MFCKHSITEKIKRGAAAAVLAALASTNFASAAIRARSRTATPIKHVIVVIAENRTFDNLFATYVPPRRQFVWNLLSEGIVDKNGNPGPNAALALQSVASDTGVYVPDPPRVGFYRFLPQPNTTYVPGLPGNAPDRRFPATLPNGPFQITKYVSYGAHTGDPVHRFFQMWQEYDGGRNDLFPWTAVTAGIGNSNKETAAAPPDRFGGETTHQGGVSMGFYNMAKGDAPYLKALAGRYALADNYHQAVMGGTGVNHVMLGTGDVPVYRDANGNLAPPPDGQIENPNPQRGGLVAGNGTPEGNYYVNDGYGNTKTGMGGSYVDCSDPSRPGVGGIMNYLNALPYRVFNEGAEANCEPGAYYLVNNYNPGYTPSGKLSEAIQPPPPPASAAGKMTTLATRGFTVPPQTFRTLADELSENGISWAYYGQGFNEGHPDSHYCGICDPFQYATSVMTTDLKKNIQGYREFERAVKTDMLPAVSFLKPSDKYDGHPSYSSPADCEKFLKRVVDLVKSHRVWKSTAIVIIFDEGGGYYDSGYIQPLDFFGDGTRVPLILVSPYARKGYVDHTYYDHVSVLKFIERNWGLSPLSDRSRDNIPNPVMPAFHAPGGAALSASQVKAIGRDYVPLNRPAIGDLMGLFDFSPAAVRALKRERRR